MVQILYSLEKAADMAGITPREFYHKAGDHVLCQSFYDDVPSAFYYSKDEIDKVKQSNAS